jgi:hypothetical protein
MAISSRRAGAAQLRQAINHFMRFLKKKAAHAGRSPRADTHDKTTLREASKLLARSVENLIRISDQNDALIVASANLPPEFARQLAARGAFIIDGHVDLSSLLWAATTIGSRALDNPVARRELAAMRTAAASKAKRDYAARRKQLVLKLADDFRRTNLDASDWYVAGMIEKPLHKALQGKRALSCHSIYRILRNHRSDLANRRFV